MEEELRAKLAKEIYQAIEPIIIREICQGIAHKREGTGPTFPQRCTGAIEHALEEPSLEKAAKHIEQTKLLEE